MRDPYFASDIIVCANQEKLTLPTTNISNHENGIDIDKDSKEKIEIAIRLSGNVSEFGTIIMQGLIYLRALGPLIPLLASFLPRGGRGGAGRGGVWGPMPSSIKIPLCNSYNV